MAQAARLCLRLQKELKLLLSDPPTGASFPRLSSAASGSGDLSVLSTIDALIEGPEGTVYENGTFTLKIQIPDRYPFHPPIVTFATPIYHPNIDNGGRICLDILNLPPKGAWQPSLNISTVLTSIGLLLSEPNPDDGLMCEASKEYKYNRQAFDHKARAMTEKYAKGAVVGSGISFNVTSNPNASTVKIHGDDKASEIENNDSAGTRTKPGEFSAGSSMSISHTKNLHMSANDVPDYQPDAHGKRKPAIGVCKSSTVGNDRVQTSRKKLSLASSSEVRKKDDCHSTHDMNSASSVYQDILKEPVSFPGMLTQPCSRAADSSTSSLPMHQKLPKTHGDSATCVEHEEPRPGIKKLSLGLIQPSIKEGRDISEKENAASANNFLTFNAQTFATKSGNNISRKLSLRPLGPLQVNEVGNNGLLGGKVSISSEETGTNQKEDGKSLLGDFESSGSEEVSMPEAIVVLDSDDSAEEDETSSSRSRLSLTRRRIGKQKIKSLNTETCTPLNHKL